MLEEPPVKTSGETILRRLLDESGILVLRFDPVSFLMCCEASDTCVHESGTDRPNTRIQHPYSGIVQPGCAKYPFESITVLKA
eukprot:CAMPEP_0180518528 /NCGR_PEP_ID=MMETSP1036_2-20121128/55153_1 /TAXON_ID=632150 /ORGANISM="Azadinium spinosum, Strain 3D9" /LENGTH=82 /DNA_ID=CAMNT_0022530707 /DNA_START=17 /DNA_END=262 /DNA_ORIENTATION=-